jgi:hypothetical protein
MSDGNDSITGIISTQSTDSRVYAIYNGIASITMSGNNNSITGIATGQGNTNFGFNIFGIYNQGIRGDQDGGSITIGDGNNNSIFGKGVDETLDRSGGIFNNVNATISIGNGNNNSITGEGEFWNGIWNRGSITMGNGNNNSISGTGISDVAYGLYNDRFIVSTEFYSSNITMGNGDNNSMIGIAEGIGSIGLFNEFACSITMGNGDHNFMIGTAEGDNSIGLSNGGFGSGSPSDLLGDPSNATITMGNGDNHSITGIAEGSGSIGILNYSECSITMGDGKDTLTGMGDIGILNDGTINMGGGKDTVIADGGFDGSGTIYLGDGNDLIQGFGKQIVDGGNGKDTADLGIAYDSGILSPVVGDPFGIQIGEMVFTSVEQFVFSGDITKTLAELQAVV